MQHSYIIKKVVFYLNNALNNEAFFVVVIPGISNIHSKLLIHYFKGFFNTNIQQINLSVVFFILFAAHHHRFPYIYTHVPIEPIQDSFSSEDPAAK